MANQPYNYSKHIFIDHLLETKHAPLAREKRRTWWQKVKDCYHAIAGQNIFDFFNKEPAEKVHVGAFDYATAYFQIGLLKLVQKIEEKFDKVNENLPNNAGRWQAFKALSKQLLLLAVGVGVFALMGLLHAIRTIVAAALTLVFLPIVTAVDFVSKLLLLPEWWAIRVNLQGQPFMRCNSYSALQRLFEKHKNFQITIEKAEAIAEFDVDNDSYPVNNTDSYSIKCGQSSIYVTQRCAQAFFNLNLGRIQDKASDEIRASVFSS